MPITMRDALAYYEASYPPELFAPAAEPAPKARRTRAAKVETTPPIPEVIEPSVELGVESPAPETNEPDGLFADTEG